MEEVVDAAREAITSTPRKRVRSLAEQIGVSAGTVWEICRDGLLFPHNMQLSHPLSEDGIERGYASAREYGALLVESHMVL
jgi:hypothetical protein